MRPTLGMRDRLIAYVKKVVVDEKTLLPLQKEKEKLSEVFEGIIEKKYDQKDMVILRKYDKASAVTGYYFNYKDSTSYEIIHFPVYKKKLLAPSNYSQNTLEYDMKNDVKHKDVEKCARAQIEHSAANEIMRKAYLKLINSCTTTNQLAEVWPEVKSVFPEWFEPKKSTALIPLSKDELAFIRADSFKRIKAASKNSEKK